MRSPNPNPHPFPMRSIGIDPGLATIGIGVVDAIDVHSYRAVEWLTLETAAGRTLPDRLAEIQKDLGAYLRDMKPDVAVVEKIFFSTNIKTAIDVAQARGVILATIALQNIPVIEITPLQLKSAVTGDGQADKRQMQDMLKMLLKLDQIPRPDDAADALGLAVYGALQASKPTIIA